MDTEKNFEIKQKRTSLMYIQFALRLSYGLAWLFLIISFSMETNSQNGISNALYKYAQNCDLFDFCSLNRNQTVADEIHDYSTDLIAGYVLLFCTIMLLSVRTCLVMGKESMVVYDMIFYISGIGFMMSALYFIINLLIRTTHLTAWVPDLNDEQIKFSTDFSGKHFTSENFTEILAFSVSNDSSVFDHTKNSYDFLLGSLILFFISSLIQAMKCHYKHLAGTGYKSEKKDYNAKKTKHISKRIPVVVQWLMNLTYWILLIVALLKINDYSDNEIEMRMEAPKVTNEFNTSSRYYTVWVQDVFDGTNPDALDYISQVGLDGNIQFDEADENKTRSEVYGISNVCKEQKDSMLKKSTVQTMVGLILAFKSIAVVMQFALQIYLMNSKSHDKAKPIHWWLKRTIIFFNILSTGFLLFYSTHFFHNSLSTQCNKSGLINSSPSDYFMRLVSAILALEIALQYREVQIFDSFKGVNGVIDVYQEGNKGSVIYQDTRP